MATEKLYRLRLVGLQKEKEQVLDFLQERGMMHISPVEELDNSHHLDRDKPLPVMERISGDTLELKWMQEQLAPYAPPLSPPPFSGQSVRETMEEVSALKKELHTPLFKTVTLINRNREQLKEKGDLLALLEKVPFDTGMSAFPHEGRITFSWILEALQEEKEQLDLHELFKDYLDRITLLIEGRLVFIQGLSRDREALEQLIKQEAVRMVSIPELKQGKDLTIKELRSTLSRLKKENAKAASALKALAGRHYRDVVRLNTLMDIFHDRHEAATSFLRTQRTFVMEGYIPVHQYPALQQLQERARVHILSEEVQEAPTKLRHLPYVKHYAFVTKMFGLPGYARLDPTLYLSFFIPLFFGFMFSDIGYGILLLMLSAFLIWKSTPQVPILKDAGAVLLTCSLTTMLFGWLFGSFFGNLIVITPLLFDPFAGAKTVLIIGLAIGLIHVNLGVILSSFEHLRRKAFKEFLVSNLPLFLLQAGAFLLAVGLRISGLFALGTALLLLIVKSKMMGLLEVTGFLGTWLSYARLLAMSLATGGIALSINIMSKQLAAVKLFGPALFVLLIVAGHLFNFVINVLGSSINSVRLHYIEFFSQWFEGGGRPFQSFTTERVKDTF